MSKEEIECEEITIKIPKKLMDCWRAMAKALGRNPDKYLQHDIVDSMRAEIEAQGGKLLIKMFKLELIFNKILNDGKCK